MTDSRRWFTPLVYAAGNDAAAAVSRILDAPGVNIDEKDGKGRTALMAAAASGFEAMVATLLTRGADLAIKDSRGADAAGHARANGYPAIEKMIENEAQRRTQEVVSSLTAGAQNAIQVAKTPLRFRPSASTGGTGI